MISVSGNHIRTLATGSCVPSTALCVQDVPRVKSWPTAHCMLCSVAVITVAKTFAAPPKFSK
jgi:hypothetical protein